MASPREVMENKGSAITWIYRYVGEPQVLARPSRSAKVYPHVEVVKQIALELIRFLDPTNQAGLLYGVSCLHITEGPKSAQLH
eukprot:6077183-Amphidinium_carterae.1